MLLGSLTRLYEREFLNCWGPSIPASSSVLAYCRVSVCLSVLFPLSLMLVLLNYLYFPPFLCDLKVLPSIFKN